MVCWNDCPGYWTGSGRVTVYGRSVHPHASDRCFYHDWLGNSGSGREMALSSNRACNNGRNADICPVGRYANPGGLLEKPGSESIQEECAFQHLGASNRDTLAERKPIRDKP